MNGSAHLIHQYLENSASVVIFSLDHSYRYTYFTQLHKTIMQRIWNVEIKLGDNMLDFLSPLDREKAKQNFDRALAGEAFTRLEEYGDEKLQRSFWEDRYEPLRGSDGEINGVLVFVIDISERMNTARQLETVQARLQLALSASKMGVWEWDVKTNRIYWSDEVNDIFRVAHQREDFSYSQYVALIHPADRERVLRHIDKTLKEEGESNYRVEHRIIAPDNQIYWVAGAGQVLRDRDGQPQRLLGTVQDITERKKAEQEKFNWERRYDLVVNASGQMIYDYDLVSGEIFWTGNTLEILGFTNEEMGDINRWTMLIHPQDRDRVLQALEVAQQNNAKFSEAYRFGTASGLYRFVSDRGFFLNDPLSGQIRMLGIMEDITAQKDAEYTLIQKNEELTKTNRELDSFVYSASHDLRAPIASMLGLIQVARLENDPSKMEMLFKLQEKTLKKLDHFIRDIVDHSRNARAEVQCELIQLAQLIEESFAQFHFLDNLAFIRKQVQVNQTTPFYSDLRRMQVVLNNLISNAIKYADLSKSQPYILIDATVTPAQATIRIEDNGEGIAPSLHSRIFEMFYRASGKSSGSGLGLYIVREVLHKIGGSISLQSGPGEGTTFTIVVPNRAPV